MLPTVLAALVAASLVAPLSSPTPQAPQLTSITATTEEALADWDRKIAHLIRQGELTLREEKPSGDGTRREQWYEQRHKGVPVVGAEVWREIEGKKTVALEGSIYSGIALPVTPKLSAAEARVVFITLAKGSPGPSLQPMLAVLPQPDRYVLVYRARVLAGGEVTFYSIDASTGAIVASDVDSRPTP
jgi:hypothetical protein